MFPSDVSCNDFFELHQLLHVGTNLLFVFLLADLTRNQVLWVFGDIPSDALESLKIVSNHIYYRQEGSVWTISKSAFRS